MKPVFAHIRRLWPGPGVWLPLPFVIWPIVALAIHDLRPEHALFFFLVPFLAYFRESTKRFFFGLYPIGLVGLVYDGMRYWKNVGVTASRVHVCDLRALDMKIVSTSMGSAHDWLQAHASPALDLICAVPYGTFIPAAFGFAIWMYGKDYPRMVAFTWTFALLNFAGFITYHIYPAAPPWYFHAHGCVVDLTAHASEGPNLARVDQWLGFSYFGGMYGRSSDVFGAVPSLHVAYPTIITLFGWPRFNWPLRIFALLYSFTMYFAAVYLDHHWVFDALLGLVYTFAIFGAVRYLPKWLAKPQASRDELLIT